VHRNFVESDGQVVIAEGRTGAIDWAALNHWAINSSASNSRAIRCRAILYRAMRGGCGQKGRHKKRGSAH